MTYKEKIWKPGTPEGELLWKYGREIRKLKARQKKYVDLTRQRAKDSREVVQTGEFGNIGFVGSVRGVGEEIKQMMSGYMGRNLNWDFVSGCVFAKNLQKRHFYSNSYNGSNGEWVVAIFDSANHNLNSSITDTPWFRTPAEFNAHLLQIAVQGRKLLADPYANMNDPKLENWIMSSATSTAALVNTPTISINCQDERGQDRTIFTFEDEQNNPNIGEFRDFTAQYDKGFDGYEDVLDLRRLTRRSPYGNGDISILEVDANQAVYDGFNVCYYDPVTRTPRPTRPRFTVTFPHYNPQLNMYFLTMLGTNDDVGLDDPAARIELLERMNYQTSQSDMPVPSACRALGDLINEGIAEYHTGQVTAIHQERRDFVGSQVKPMILHEMRTPLTAARGAADLIGIMANADPAANRAVIVDDLVPMMLAALKRVEHSVQEGIEDAHNFRAQGLQFTSPDDIWNQIETYRVNLNALKRGKTLLLDYVPDQEDFDRIAFANLEVMLARSIENIIHNMMKYSVDPHTEAGVTIHGRVKRYTSVIDHPELNTPERMIFFEFDSFGNEPDAEALGIVNNRANLTTRVATESGVGGVGLVMTRAVSDYSYTPDSVRTQDINLSVQSPYLSMERLSETTDGQEQGTRIRLGFRLQEQYQRLAEPSIRRDLVVTDRKGYLETR